MNARVYPLTENLVSHLCRHVPTEYTEITKDDKHGPIKVVSVNMCYKYNTYIVSFFFLVVVFKHSAYNLYNTYII